jgi:hypothetical protein
MAVAQDLDWMPISLGGSSALARHGQEGLARLVNCYVEQVGELGKVPEVIYAIDGLTLFADASQSSNAGVRAMLVVSQTLYAVIGRQVYAIDRSGTTTLLGSIGTDGLTTMAANRKAPDPQIAIVCGGEYWLIEGGILSQINDPDLPAPVMVFEVDGYFIFIIADGRFFISGLNDGGSITPLDFATAAALSDGLVAGARRGRDVLLFGQRSTEAWQDTGNADFPFERGQVMAVGCYAAGSVAPLTAVVNDQTVDTVAWAATDSEGGYIGIMLLVGYSTLKISTYDIDRLVSRDPAPNDIRAFAWAEGGHVFYAITGTGYSKVYDTSNGRWHDRESYGLDRWRCSCHAQFGAMHIFGDYASPVLYRSSPAVYTENGQPIICDVYTPPVHAEPFALKYYALQVDAVMGVGLNSTDTAVSDPEIEISWSDDGGATYGPGRLERLGADGDRRRRIITRNLGTAVTRTFRLRVSAAVVRGLMAAKVKVRRMAA